MKERTEETRERITKETREMNERNQEISFCGAFSKGTKCTFMILWRKASY